MAEAKWQSEECRAEFAQRLARSGVDFDREAIVVMRHVYGGTGMARAQYSMSGPVDGVLTCAIRVSVPDGPSTRDTASFGYAFVVSKTLVSSVRITDLGREAGVASVGAS